MLFTADAQRLTAYRTLATRAFWVLALVAVAGFAAYAVSRLRDGHNWGDDFGLYLHIARNLLEGRPYAWLVRGILVPPGFPLILAGWQTLFGSGFITLKIINVVLWICVALVASAIALRQLGLAAAVFVLAVHLLMPGYFYIHQSILSDIPFMALSDVSLLFGLLALTGENRWHFLAAALAGSTLLAALSVRPAGLPIVAAFVAGAVWNAIIKRFDRGSPSAGLALIVCALAALALNFVLFGYAASGQTAVALRNLIDPHDFWGTLLRSIGHRAGQEQANLHILFFAFPIIQWKAMALLAATIVGLAAYVRRSRDGVIPVFFLAYLGMLLITPWQGGPRYLLPLLTPIALFLAAPFTVAIDAWRNWPGRARGLSGTAALVILALEVALCVEMAGKVREASSYNDDETSDARTQEALEFLRTHTGEEETICSSKPRAVMFFIRRPGCWLAPGDAGPYAPFLRAQGARYALVMMRPEAGMQAIGTAMARESDMILAFRNRDYAIYEAR